MSSLCRLALLIRIWKYLDKNIDDVETRLGIYVICLIRLCNGFVWNPIEISWDCTSRYWRILDAWICTWIIQLPINIEQILIKRKISLRKSRSPSFHRTEPVNFNFLRLFINYNLNCLLTDFDRRAANCIFLIVLNSVFLIFACKSQSNGTEALCMCEIIDSAVTFYGELHREFRDSFRLPQALATPRKAFFRAPIDWQLNYFFFRHCHEFFPSSTVTRNHMTMKVLKFIARKLWKLLPPMTQPKIDAYISLAVCKVIVGCDALMNLRWKLPLY